MKDLLRIGEPYPLHDGANNLKHTGMGGQPRNNIYDIAGNVWEWTSEFCALEGKPCTHRAYDYDAVETPAMRLEETRDTALSEIGFRATLFIAV